MFAELGTTFACSPVRVNYCWWPWGRYRGYRARLAQAMLSLMPSPGWCYLGLPQHKRSSEAHGGELVCPVYGDILLPLCQKEAFSLQAVVRRHQHWVELARQLVVWRCDVVAFDICFITCLLLLSEYPLVTMHSISAVLPPAKLLTL